MYGRVAAEPLQVIPVGRNAHSIRTDESNRFLVASGEKSETISVNPIDQSIGTLRLQQKYPAGKAANCVEIVNSD